MTQETSLYWEYDQSNGDIPFLKPTRIGADAAGLAVATAVFFHGEMIGAVCIGIIQTWNPQIQMDTQPTTGMDKMGVSRSSWGYIPKKGLMYKGKSQPKMDDDLGVALFQETTISGWGYYTRIKKPLDIAVIWIIIEMEWYIFVQYCRDDEIHFTMEWITIEMENSNLKF